MCMARSVAKTGPLGRAKRPRAREHGWPLAETRWPAHKRWVLVQLMLVWSALNALTGCVYAYDKWRAARGGWRVRERTLLGLAAVGGAAGALVAMRACRHKTRKPAFRWGVPALLLAQVALVAWLLRHHLG